jgi:hypothetical protein
VEGAEAAQEVDPDPAQHESIVEALLRAGEQARVAIPDQAGRAGAAGNAGDFGTVGRRLGVHAPGWRGSVEERVDAASTRAWNDAGT